MDDTLFFRLGNSAEHVTVRIVGDVATDDPIGWVPCEISVAVGAFRATYLATLTAKDFEPFYKALSLAHQRLHGTARFDTLEGQLTIDVEGDGKGHFIANGLAVDEAGIGNKLSFKIKFDQTELTPTLHELEAFCEAIRSAR